MPEYHAPTSDTKIRVLAAESSQTATQLLLETLRKESDFSVVGLVTAPDGIIAGIKEFNPEVVIIGIGPREAVRQNIELVEHIASSITELKIIAILESPASEMLAEVFRCGARGVLCRDELASLCQCVRAVHRGQVWASYSQLSYVLQAFSNGIPQPTIDINRRAPLFNRKLDVLRCVSKK